MASVKSLPDLSICAQEQIRTPEQIQPHGCLVALDQKGILVRFSRNFSALLNLAPPVAGIALEKLFPAELVTFLTPLLMGLSISPERTFHGKLTFLKTALSVCVYRAGSLDVIELIPSDDSPKAGGLAYEVRANVQYMQSLNTLDSKLEFVANFVQQISGFARVMVYRFDRDYNGEVIAEQLDKNAALESYLGLHYPESDIPEQARALYQQNLVRFISDVNYTPDALHPAAAEPLDLSQSLLRSISPFHIQYMKNMGTGSSLVGSLLARGKLWGLVACHNLQATTYSYELVEAFRWLMILVGQEIDVAELKQRERQRRQLTSLAQSAIAELRVGKDSFSEYFQGKSVRRLLKGSRSDSVACCLDGRVFTVGDGPNVTELKCIVERLVSSGLWDCQSSYATNRLPKLLKEPDERYANCAGLMLVPVADGRESYILFTRKECFQHVTWGGNPDKPVKTDGSGALTPRNSFSAWKTIVRGTSLPWSDADLESAQAFGGTIDVELKRRAEHELRLLSSSLDNINDTVIITDAVLEKTGPAIIYVNQAFEKQTGYSKSEALGKTPRMLHGPETARKELDQIRQALKSNEPVRVELLNYTKEARPYWSEIEISPLFSDAGTVSHFASVQRDITIRKAREGILEFIANNDWKLDRERFLLDLCQHVSELLGLSAMLIAERAEGAGSKVLNASVAVLNREECTNTRLTTTLSLGRFKPDVVFFIDKALDLQPVYRIHEFWSKADSNYAAGVWLKNAMGEPETLVLLTHPTPFASSALVEQTLGLLKGHIALEALRRQSSDTIWKQANFDSLTGVPNRRMFRDRLGQAILKCSRQEGMGALLMLDLDNFKEINDIHGHAAGDQLLVQAVKRLSNVLRESDTVARLGGDEFIILLENLNSTYDAMRVAQHVVEEMRDPILLEGNLVYASFSIGVAVFPSDTSDPDQLIAYADQAMYRAKARGRNRYVFFTPDLQEKVLLRARLAHDLHGAVAKEELFLVYQPIVDLPSRRIVKAEALIRWQHPELGLISPVDFIPIAEETGQITAIGDWVFAQATKCLADIRKHYGLGDFQISINKSPLQFRETAENQGKWFNIMTEAGVPSSAIIVEITESSMVADKMSSSEVLKLFRDKGVEVAIDDFGTGYSALAYLQRYDIDYLKIDRSFIGPLKANSDELALVEAVIWMGHRLGIRIVAEGIETEEQLSLLITAGLDLGQGYLFSRPVPEEELLGMLVVQSAVSVTL